MSPSIYRPIFPIKLSSVSVKRYRNKSFLNPVSSYPEVLHQPYASARVHKLVYVILVARNVMSLVLLEYTYPVYYFITMCFWEGFCLFIFLPNSTMVMCSSATLIFIIILPNLQMENRRHLTFTKRGGPMSSLQKYWPGRFCNKHQTSPECRSV